MKHLLIKEGFYLKKKEKNMFKLGEIKANFQVI